MGTEIENRIQQTNGRVNEVYNRAMADHAALVADSEALRLRNIGLSEALDLRDQTVIRLERELAEVRKSEQNILMRYTELLTSMNNAATVLTNAVSNAKGDVGGQTES
jgi:ribonuclease HIII